MTDSPILPGRLGDPTMVIKTDPRSDPRMVAAMTPIGLDVAPEPAGVDINSAPNDLLEYALAAEEGFGALGGVLAMNAPPITNVDRRTEIIKGIDGNDISLYIHTPTDTSGPVPGIVHTPVSYTHLTLPTTPYV